MEEMAQVLEHLPPKLEPRKSSWLLALAWLSNAHCDHLGSEQE